MKIAYLVGLGVVAGAGGAASVAAAKTAATPDSAGQIAVWLLAAASAVVVLALWRWSAHVLQSDRAAGATAAQTKHLADVALLAGGFAHEARNGLNAMRSRIALLRKKVAGDDDLTRRVDQVQEVATTLEDLVTDFLTFGRPPADELSDVHLSELVAEVLDFEQFDLEEAGAAVENSVDDDAVVLADRAKLKRALLNLVVNARQAMPEGGVIRIGAEAMKDHVTLTVADTGVGIPASSLGRVFETYFSTKSEGTGLGLAIVRQTIEGFGGTISCESVEGKGTTMTISLPSGGRRGDRGGAKTKKASPAGASA